MIFLDTVKACRNFCISISAATEELISTLTGINAAEFMQVKHCLSKAITYATKASSIYECKGR